MWQSTHASFCWWVDVPYVWPPKWYPPAPLKTSACGPSCGPQWTLVILLFVAVRVFVTSTRDRWHHMHVSPAPYSPALLPATALVDGLFSTNTAPPSPPGTRSG